MERQCNQPRALSSVVSCQGGHRSRRLMRRGDRDRDPGSRRPAPRATTWPQVPGQGGPVRVGRITKSLIYCVVRRCWTSPASGEPLCMQLRCFYSNTELFFGQLVSVSLWLLFHTQTYLSEKEIFAWSPPFVTMHSPNLCKKYPCPIFVETSMSVCLRPQKQFHRRGNSGQKPEEQNQCQKVSTER